MLPHRKRIAYDRLTDDERFAAVIAAIDRADQPEVDRLMLTAPLAFTEQHGPGTMELLEASAACALVFLCHWHQGICWYTHGLMAGGLEVRKLRDPEQRAQPELLKRLARLDELQACGQQLITGLLLAWDSFCSAHRIDGPALLRAHLGDVAAGIEAMRSAQFDAWLTRTREGGQDPELAAVAARVGAELRMHWPAAVPHTD